MCGGGPLSAAAKRKLKIKKCHHDYCHRDEIETDKPVGLPWATGLLKNFPGEYTYVDESTKTKKTSCAKLKKKRGKCTCSQISLMSNPDLAVYPEYVDICNDDEVNKELTFFLNLMVLGNQHYEKHYKKIKDAEKEAKKKRKECLKKRRAEQRGEDVKDEGGKDENEYKGEDKSETEDEVWDEPSGVETDEGESTEVVK